MGLKDLTSRLDLVPGDQPVGNMETLNSKGLAGAFDTPKRVKENKLREKIYIFIY